MRMALDKLLRSSQKIVDKRYIPHCSDPGCCQMTTKCLEKEDQADLEDANHILQLSFANGIRKYCHSKSK
jgi:hypothetical protein